MPRENASEILVVADAAAWRAWLDVNEDASDGVWLLLAKKGTTSPTSLTYAQALDEALCSGWIDGQKGSVDTALFRQRFTPRRRASIWSKRNIGIVEELIARGRMRERGLREIEAAKADGRWERAYAGSATAEVPEDLAAALASSARADDRSARMTSSCLITSVDMYASAQESHSNMGTSRMTSSLPLLSTAYGRRTRTAAPPHCTQW